MPPPNNPKRKRGGERSEDRDTQQRPSPHRPNELRLGLHDTNPGQNSHQDARSPTGRGGRGRGGRGRGIYSQGSPMNNSSQDPQSNLQNFNTSRQVQTTEPPANAQSPPSAAPPTTSDHTAQKPLSAPAANNLSPSMPYEYQFLTDDRVRSWVGEGKMAVIDDARQILEKHDFVGLSSIFQEVTKAGLEGRIDNAEAGKLICDILKIDGEGSKSDASSFFLDTLSILTEADPSNPRLRGLVSETGIASSTMREQLEESVLQSIGLVRPTFGRVFIKQQTNILYRQSNYNLLREETEGYSKLITELFTTTNVAPPSDEVVKETFENVKALIGAFDLDAGRVLDVILDVFAALLVKHYRFFVKLLRASSWWPQGPSMHAVDVKSQGFGGLPSWAQPGHSGWTTTEEDNAKVSQLKDERDRQFWDRAREVGLDAFFELGSRKVLSDPEILQQLDVAAQGEDDNAKETCDWIKLTKTMPPSGSPVAAQLLGFKLRFYSSDAREASDSTPANVIYLAALLIKIGFISLRDLYPHLCPADDSMDAVKDEQLKEREKRDQAKRPGGGAMNALARAGALPDDTPPTSVTRLRDAETRAGTPMSKGESASRAATPRPSSAGSQKKPSKEQLPEPDDQKISLLRSLLNIGAIPEALYLLGRFPWIPDAFPDIPKHLHRIFHYSLHQVYDPLYPVKDRSDMPELQTFAALDQSGIPRGDLRTLTPANKILRWAKPDEVNPEDGIEYRFYWDDWNDNVPVCRTVDDVFTLCYTFLNVCGVKIGDDPALLIKIARIGRQSLAEDTSERNKTRWVDLCKRLLCPALSLTDANSGVVNEVFEVLKYFSTSTRYSIYAEWFMGATSRLPDLQRAFELTKARTKDTLKRVSKTNLKEMARALAKVACASPGVVFSVVINQIESYSNMSALVVECGRYFTYMGYDVLTWSLLNSLGKGGRNRTADGFSTNTWLIHLTQFIGKVFKRFAVINMVPVLQYTLLQLRRDNFMDLRVIREIIDNVTGIVPITDFGSSNANMAAGPLLQAQTLQRQGDRRHDNKLSAKRLTKTLVDNELAAPFLVSIAQQRYVCTFMTQQDSLKVVGENFDEISAVFVQYLDLLRATMPVSDFNEVVPPLAELVSTYGLEPSIALMVYRKSIAQKLEEYNRSHSDWLEPFKAAEQSKLSPAGGSTATKETESKTNSNEAGGSKSVNSTSNETADKEDVVMTDVAEEKAVEVPSNSDDGSTTQPWHPALRELMDELRLVVNQDVIDHMGLPFYATFWQLSPYDLCAHSEPYDKEIRNQNAMLANLRNDKSDMSTSAMRRRDQDRKAIEAVKEQLTNEKKAHIRDATAVEARLKIESRYWFSEITSKLPLLEVAIVTNCFFPRLILSPVDALYTFKFFMTMHSIGTPKFRTMHILDFLFNEKTIANMIYRCSPNEAQNLAYFLNDVFRELSAWHRDRATYEKRAHGVDKQLQGFADLNRDGTVKHQIDFEEFRRLLFKWHQQLQQGLLSLMKSPEYVHNKNAMIIMQKMVEYFPVINFHGNQLLEAVERLVPRTGATRTDIEMQAISLRSFLTKRKKLWVLPQAFRLNDAALKNQRSSSRSQPPQSKPLSTDQPSSGSANAESQKQEAAISDGIKSSIDVEDGELEDIEMADTKENGVKQRASANGTTGEPKTSKQPSAASAGNEIRDKPTATTTPSRSTPAQGVRGAQPATTDDAQRATAPSHQSSGTPRSDQVRDTASPASNRQPHALPSRPEAPAFRRPDRLSSRQPGHTPERPDSRSRNRVDANHDSAQQNTDTRQRVSSSHGGSTAQSARSAAWVEAGKPADYLSQRNANEASTGPTTRSTRSSAGHHDGNDAAPRQNEGILSRQERLDSRGYRDSTSTSRSHSTAYHTSAQDYRPSERPRRDEPNGSAFDAQSHHSQERLPAQDLARGHNTRQTPLDRGDARSNAPYSSRGDHGRDTRPDGPVRMSSNEHRASPRDQQADFAPSGPRGGRSTRAAGQQGQSASEAAPASNTRSQIDHRNERYSQDSPRPPRPQDPSYGRLNADPGRPTGQDQTPPSTRPSSSTGNMQTPLDRRPGPRNQSSQPAQSSNGAEAQERPTNMPRTSERSSSRADTNMVTNGSTAEGPSAPVSGVHPSRLSQIKEARPPPIQTQVESTVASANAQATTVPPATTAATNAPTISPAMPPSGPRSATARAQGNHPQNSTGISPTGRRPAASASFASGRQGHDRRFAGIQDTLQQNAQPLPGSSAASVERTEDRGASIRGRAGAERQQTAQPATRSAAAHGPSAPPNRGPISADAPRALMEQNGDGDYRRRGQAPPQTALDAREQDDGRHRVERHRNQNDSEQDREREKGRLRSSRDTQRGQERDRERDRDYEGRPRREGDESRYQRGFEREREVVPSQRESMDMQFGDRPRASERQPREEERERRDRGPPREDVFQRQLAPRHPSGPNPEIGSAGIWPNEGSGRPDTRRLDGRERRDTAGGGRYSEGRKRGWTGDDGRPPAEHKRPRRTGP